MPFVKVTHTYEVSGEECQNTFHYFNDTIIPTPTIVGLINGYFSEHMVPGFSAVFTDVVTSTKVSTYAPNLGYSVDLTIENVGEIEVGSAGTLSVDIAADIKRSLGATYLNDNGSLYTGNRQIRRGRFYLSGLPLALMKSTGYNPLSAYATPFNAMLNGQDNPIVLGGSSGTWIAVVVGFPLAAVPSTPEHPVGKDSRPYVVAPLVGAACVGFSDLHTREG